MAPSNCLSHFIIDVRRQLTEKRSRTGSSTHQEHQIKSSKIQPEAEKMIAAAPPQLSKRSESSNEDEIHSRPVFEKILDQVGEEKQTNLNYCHIDSQMAETNNERFAQSFWSLCDDESSQKVRLRRARRLKQAIETRAIPFDRLASCPSSAKLLYTSSPVAATTTTLAAINVSCLLVAALIMPFICSCLLVIPVLANEASKTTISSAPLSLPMKAQHDEQDLLGSVSKASSGIGNKLSSVDWPRIGSQLIRQLSTNASGLNHHHRDRWVNLQVNGNNVRNQYRPSLLSTWNSQPPPSRRPQNNGPQLNPLGAFGNNQYNRFNRIWDQFRDRLGARNSIRVHNAFRDLAWRILSRLSMPTPVIYELRRQHFYPIEEDLMNDMLFDKNTRKTIRSKRYLKIGEQLLSATNRAKRIKELKKRAADDDDEEDSLSERFRLRLEDLVNLSRRSLFGRVVRLPSLFPFRRRHNDESPSEKSNNDLDDDEESSTKRIRFILDRRRRRRKEADRQRIFINGKQYYVDDDGSLKEHKGLDSDP